MTIRSFVPLVITVGLFVLAWIINQVSPEVERFIRVFNGFSILTLLIWVVMRVLSYEDELRAHRAEMLLLMTRGEDNRTKTIQAYMEQASAIAQERAADAVRQTHQTVAQTVASVNRQIEASTSVLSEKLDLLKDKPNGP